MIGIYYKYCSVSIGDIFTLKTGQLTYESSVNQLTQDLKSSLQYLTTFNPSSPTGPTRGNCISPIWTRCSI